MRKFYTSTPGTAGLFFAVTRTICLSFLLVFSKAALAQRPVWSSEKASAWYAGKGWLRGCDYIPSTAINQLEMWQAPTFDTTTIDKELGFAESIGLNCMRVFLHHIAWQEDPAGFKHRIAQYLAISTRHHISTIFVFFDDCWNETYHPGTQPVPKPGIHNSGWLRDPGKLWYGSVSDTAAPGADTLASTLEMYVKDILNTFSHDNRILLWDLYNEPGNSGYNGRSLPLLDKVFRWGREADPDQPLSAGIWNDSLDSLNAWQLSHSDVITYHNYAPPTGHQQCIDTLKKYGRPLLCTEYMARPRNSTFFNIMPMLKKENIAAINWGLVTGKTNTKYAWDKPMPDGAEPTIWFHDIFRPDGTPYDPNETTFIRNLTLDSVPLGGNAWRSTTAGDGAIAGSALTGGRIDTNGIIEWTDSTVWFDTRIRVTDTGSLHIWLCAKVPQGRSRLQVGLGPTAPATVVDIEGAVLQRYDCGAFTIKDTGYQYIRIHGLSRTGSSFAEIPAIVLQGTALNGITSFVPNNEGNFFHWGRRGPSVHLNYPLPAGYDAAWFYNEVTVPEGQDIPGSYFMACGFAQGYFGMQVNSPTERHILFSIWSPFETDNPAAIPDSQRIVLVKKGTAVHAGSFGDEGAGGQSYLNYPWKAGHTYRFLVHTEPADHQHTIFTAWFYAPEEGHWRLIASFSRPQTRTGLNNLYSFLENFEPEQGTRQRYVLFNHAWVEDQQGHWISLNKARFSVDNTGRKGYRMDYGGGVRKGGFYLRNDGFFNDYTPAGIWLERPADKGERGPDIGLPR